MVKSRNSRCPKKSWQKMRTARHVTNGQNIWPSLVPTTDLYHPGGESVLVCGWQAESAAPKFADARWVAFDSLCCHAVLPTRFTAESLCLAYRASIEAAVYHTLQDDGRFQRGCAWLAEEAFQLGVIAIWRHAPTSLDRLTMPEHIGPDGFDVGPDLTDVASAYYRSIVERVLRKARKAERNRRQRQRRTVTTYLQGQCRLHPDEEELKTCAVRLPRDAWMPVAPTVVEDEEARYLKAEEAVTSAYWSDLDRRIVALKEQGDLSDAEIGGMVGQTGTQVNRAWHGVLERAEKTLGLDGDDEKYRKCNRRKRRRDTPARRSRGHAAFWSVAWASFHGNRLPDDPMPDTAGLFDEDGYKLGPLPRC